MYMAMFLFMKNPIFFVNLNLYMNFPNELFLTFIKLNGISKLTILFFSRLCFKEGTICS